MGIITSEMQQTAISCFCFTLLMAFSEVLGATQNECKTLKCGVHGPPISFPFSLKGSHPDHCGYPGFVVSCNERHQTILELPNTPVKFSIKSINYRIQEIQLYDPDNCLLVKFVGNQKMSFSPFRQLTRDLTLFNCSSVIQADSYYYEAVPCLSIPSHHIYAVDSSYDIAYLPSCTKMYNIFSVPFISRNEIYLYWSKPNCTVCQAEGKVCRLKNNATVTKSEIECVHMTKSSNGATTKLVATGATLGSFVLLLLVIAVYHVYSNDKNEKENQLKIERFLEDYKALKPSRYSYADIKRITNQFKDKLGQGAYGTVFKGKLSDEFFVAVKVLKNSKGNGEEFINEVGTMGHIHHVNVVRLVGFCADGFIRALVYEFLPNGSLHEFISSELNQNDFPSWEKLHHIALGIANGIEYLHQGCDQRILHFDIKPQNVLLDRNFTPKLSDFGLAKLCSKDQSIVSMTTARGTMGYIAPEVFSRNFGNVSYKSDVYSFGMLLLEMVGGRRNVGTATENTKEVYYPEFIYNLLKEEEEEELQMHTGEEGDAKIQKQLGIIGLWCIQWHPVDRPSMKVVVQMLERGDNLTMPPNPFGSAGDATGIKASPSGRNLNSQLETIVELE